MYSLSTATWQEVVRRLDRRITAGKVYDYYEVVFAEMVAEKLLTLQSVHFEDGRWFEIDTLEDLRSAEELFIDSRRARRPQTRRSFVIRLRWSPIKQCRPVTGPITLSSALNRTVFNSVGDQPEMHR